MPALRPHIHQHWIMPEGSTTLEVPASAFPQGAALLARVSVLHNIGGSVLVNDQISEFSEKGISVVEFEVSSDDGVTVESDGADIQNVVISGGGSQNFEQSLQVRHRVKVNKYQHNSGAIAVVCDVVRARFAATQTTQRISERVSPVKVRQMLEPWASVYDFGDEVTLR